MKQRGTHIVSYRTSLNKINASTHMITTCDMFEQKFIIMDYPFKLQIEGKGIERS